jgi:hypothetical protein
MWYLLFDLKENMYDRGRKDVLEERMWPEVSWCLCKWETGFLQSTTVRQIDKKSLALSKKEFRG